MSDIVPNILLVGDKVHLNERVAPALRQMAYSFEGAREVNSAWPSDSWVTSTIAAAGGLYFWREVVPYG